MSNTILGIVSGIHTTLPSGSQPHSVEQMHHGVHVHMHPSLWSLNDSDWHFHCSVLSDCYISISKFVSA